MSDHVDPGKVFSFLYEKLGQISYLINNIPIVIFLSHQGVRRWKELFVARQELFVPSGGTPLERTFCCAARTIRSFNLSRRQFSKKNKFARPDGYR